MARRIPWAALGACLIACICSPPLRSAGLKTAQGRHRGPMVFDFVLSRGQSVDFPFAMGGEGRLKVKIAPFPGDAELARLARVAVLLKGPRGHVLRRGRGGLPREFVYDATERVLRHGRSWRVILRNQTRAGLPVRGILSLELESGKKEAWRGTSALPYEPSAANGASSSRAVAHRQRFELGPGLRGFIEIPLKEPALVHFEAECVSAQSRPPRSRAVRVNVMMPNGRLFSAKTMKLPLRGLFRVGRDDLETGPMWRIELVNTDDRRALDVVLSASVEKAPAP